MVRLFHAYVPNQTLALGVSEVVFIALAFVTAVFVRFGRDTDMVLGYEHGIEKIAIVVGIFLVCMYYLDLYDDAALSNSFQTLPRLLQVVGLGSLLVTLVYYIFPPARLGPSIVVGGSAIAVVSVSCWRQFFLSVIRRVKLAEPVLLLGGGSLACALSNELKRRPELGFDLLGYAAREPIASNGLAHLGTPEQLPALVTERHVSRVVVVMQDRRGQLPLEQLLTLKPQGVAIQDGKDLYEMVTGKVFLESLRPSWLLFSGFQVSRSLLLYKRLFSIIFSVIALILTAPLMLLVAISVYLDSPGPVIFRQHRVGRDSKLFPLYKFRTMRDRPISQDHSRPAQEKDDRFTRVGRWLRRTRLDELPQLYNILRGDMYFVGPRPFMARQEADLVKQLPFYRYRWLIKPGATGWAQVNRGYCATLEDNAEKLAYDLYYVRNMSIGLDLVILCRTLKILLLGRGSR